MELITDITSLVRLVKSSTVGIYGGTDISASCFLFSDGKQYEVVIRYHLPRGGSTRTSRGIDEDPYWAAFKAVHTCGVLVHMGRLCAALDITDQDLQARLMRR